MFVDMSGKTFLGMSGKFFLGKNINVKFGQTVRANYTVPPPKKDDAHTPMTVARLAIDHSGRVMLAMQMFHYCNYSMLSK